MVEVADVQRARSSSREELAPLLHHPSSEVLLAVLDNPALGDADVCVLLARKTLPAEVIEEILRRRELLKAYAIKRALACHPH
nr:hypothetical protein [Acidobacteriota bacterium]